RANQETAVGGMSSSADESSVGNQKSAEELHLKNLLKRGQKQEAVDIIMQYIEAAAQQKNFGRAEKLRNTLIQIDSMQLSKIIRAAEIIEEHKQFSIPAEHQETWRSLIDLLGAEEFAALYHVMTLKQYSRGEMVVRQGAFLAQLLFVNSGQIQVFAHVRGSEVPLKTVAQGEVVGGRTFFESSVWTVSARSLGAELLILPRKQLTRLQQTYPSMESKLIDFGARFVPTNMLFQKTRRNRRRFERKALEGRAVAALLNTNNTDTGIEMKGDLFDISRGGVSFCVHISKKQNAEKLFRRRVRVGIPVGKGAGKIYHYHYGVIVAVRGHHVVSNEYSIHIQFDTHLDFQEVERILGDGSGK
ncbi:MAG: Crp/Fnr family transcriptional regulator, partial [Desulfopila sp.]